MPVGKWAVEGMWKVYLDLLGPSRSDRIEPYHLSLEERRELVELGVRLHKLWANVAARRLSEKQSFSETDERDVYRRWTFAATARGEVGVRGENSRSWGSQEPVRASERSVEGDTPP